MAMFHCLSHVRFLETTTILEADPFLPLNFKLFAYCFVSSSRPSNVKTVCEEIEMQYEKRGCFLIRDFYCLLLACSIYTPLPNGVPPRLAFFRPNVFIK